MMIRSFFAMLIVCFILSLVLIGFGFYGIQVVLGNEIFYAFLITFSLVIIANIILTCVLVKNIKKSLEKASKEIDAYIKNVLNKIPKPIRNLILKAFGLKK